MKKIHTVVTANNVREFSPTNKTQLRFLFNPNTITTKTLSVAFFQ